MSGLPEESNCTNKSIGTSSVLALACKETRRFAVFTNDSDAKIYLSFGNKSVIGKGIRLNPNGGSYEIAENNMFKGNVFAIATEAGKNLSVLEIYGIIPEV